MTEGQHTYRYPRPMVTVDAVVFTVRGGRLEVLLVKRGHEPFKGMWALPGGFVDMDEELGDAAARELYEETGMSGIRLEQCHTFGAAGRGRRGRVITVAYAGLADWRAHAPRADDDAADAGWLPVAGLPDLATDHNCVVAWAVRWLRVLSKAPGELERLLHGELASEEVVRALEAVSCDEA